MFTLSYRVWTIYKINSYNWVYILLVKIYRVDDDDDDDKDDNDDDEHSSCDLNI